MGRSRKDKDSPLFMISVVSEILNVHPQTLRMYEREGFVHPHRVNQQRLYTQGDVDRLKMVIKLTKQRGVNKAGVDVILQMRSRFESLQSELLEFMESMEVEMREDLERRLRRIFSEE